MLNNVEIIQSGQNEHSFLKFYFNLYLFIMHCNIWALSALLKDTLMAAVKRGESATHPDNLGIQTFVLASRGRSFPSGRNQL